MRQQRISGFVSAGARRFGSARVASDTRRLGTFHLYNPGLYLIFFAIGAWDPSRGDKIPFTETETKDRR